jgi:hypothetical protein
VNNLHGVSSLRGGVECHLQYHDPERGGGAYHSRLLSRSGQGSGRHGQGQPEVGRSSGTIIGTGPPPSEPAANWLLVDGSAAPHLAPYFGLAVARNIATVPRPVLAVCPASRQPGFMPPAASVFPLAAMRGPGGRHRLLRGKLDFGKLGVQLSNLMLPQIGELNR